MDSGGDDITVWALGGAGWYSLHPAPAYKSIFKEAIIKGRMWLFFLEKYEGMKATGKRITGSVDKLWKEVLI